MNYSEWLKGNWEHGPPKQPIDQPLFRDEHGLVTPISLVDSPPSDHLRVTAILHNVTENDVLRDGVEKLCKRGSWCQHYDCFSFWSHGGLRQTLVMMPDGIRQWVTTKSRWDPTLEETAAMMRWRGLCGA